MLKNLCEVVIGIGIIIFAMGLIEMVILGQNGQSYMIAGIGLMVGGHIASKKA